MSMFKKAKVVMLPTNQKATIGDLGLSKHVLNFAKNNDWINIYNPIKQHIYIISDDEIKEGDWYYDNVVLQIRQWKSFMIYNKLQHKKIIATTDTSLTYNYYDSDSYGIPQVFPFPQPSQQFIQKFVEEYNRGNIITDVLVEYEHFDELGNYIDNNYHFKGDIWKLKINSKDNTITIKKVKESWNREEVIEICKQAFIDGTYAGGFGPNEKTINSETEKWIEENL